MATWSSDGSQASIQALHDQPATQNGDIITIPSGAYSWSGTVTLTKAIILTALGIVGANPPNPPVTITDAAGANDLIAVNTNAGGHTTIAGLAFLPGVATGSYITWAGNTGTIGIVHDCSFNMPSFQIAYAIKVGITGGLVYNCNFFSTVDGGGNGPGSGSGCIHISGQYPWYNVSTLGALDSTGLINMYFEDCTFQNIYNQCIDCDDNGRINVRHCNIINTQFLTHGITSTWGGRHVDLNNNVFNFLIGSPNSLGISAVNLNRWMYWRAGTGRVWNNQVDAISSSDWGNKTSWDFIDEPLSRVGGGNGGVCETQAQYPGTRWPGTGSDGTQHPTGVVVSPSFVDPVYFWNNTAGPHSNGTTNWTTDDFTGSGACPNGPTSAVFLGPGPGFPAGRDIKFNAPNNDPSPPYSPFTYPHPLRSGVPSNILEVTITGLSKIATPLGSQVYELAYRPMAPVRF